jgi:hypothetical protein
MPSDISHRVARTVAKVFAALLLLVGREARADSKQACADAYVKAQHFRQDAKLRAAREQLLICAMDTCPAALQQDCTQWAGEVDAAMPTVVIEAKGRDGRDAVDVKVSVDGDLLLEKLDGSAVPVDPGVHTFRFQIEGAPEVEQKVVVRVGDKNRRITVDLAAQRGGEPTKEGSSGTAPANGTGTPGADAPRPIPPLVYVLGGAAIVGGVMSTVFILSTDSQVGDMDEQGCKPNCPQEDVDDAKTTQVLGYVALGVTAVALATATVLFMTRPHKPARLDPTRAARAAFESPVVLSW